MNQEQHTYWMQFKNYFGGFGVGDLITRKHMKANLPFPSTSTMDSFRRVLEKNNVLASTDTPGVYIKCHELPDDISFNEMMRRAYGVKSTGRKHLIYKQVDGLDPDPLYKSPKFSIFEME
jgi:hypothetical protein